MTALTGGAPTAPTAALGTNTTQVATTGFVLAQQLTFTAVKTANYTAAANEFVPYDSTAVTSHSVTLPLAPADKTLVGVRVVAGGVNSVSIQDGGGTDYIDGPTSLEGIGQTAVYQYSVAGTVWRLVSDAMPDFVSAHRALISTANGMAWLRLRACLLDYTHTDETVVNTTTPTEVGHCTYPQLWPEAGDTSQYALVGDLLNNSGAAVTYTFNVKLGSTHPVTSPAISLTSGANRRKVSLVVDVWHLAGGQRFRAKLDAGAGAESWALDAPALSLSGYGTAAENTSTGDRDISLRVTMGTAHASADFVKHAASLQLLKVR